MNSTISENLKYVEIKKSPLHGKGVFAIRDIIKGEIFEESHVIPILIDIDLPEELATLEYPWDKDNYGLCIGGVGSFFNHSKHFNSKVHSTDKEKNIQRYSAVRDIKKGEELTIFYHADFDKYIDSVNTV